MTGANTERVKTPAYLRAVSILLKLASPLFLAAIKKPNGPDPEEATFKHWIAVRIAVNRYLANRSTVLLAPEREALTGALRFVHDSEHDSLMYDALSPASCPCPVAVLLREYAATVIEANEEAENAA